MSLPFSDTELRVQAGRRLRDLAAGHTDIVGASVALEELTQSATPHCYEARVGVYVRPEHIAAVEKGETADQAKGPGMP